MSRTLDISITSVERCGIFNIQRDEEKETQGIKFRTFLEFLRTFSNFEILLFIPAFMLYVYCTY